MKIYTKRQLLLVVLLAEMLSVHANGDPVAAFSSINRVANPEPLSISEIRIEREQVNISHIDGYNCFDVTYKFKNESNKDFPEIHYGFPIDYVIADEQETYMFGPDNYFSESITEKGWNEILIKDIAFIFNGETLPFHSAKESVKEAGYYVDTDDFHTDSIPIDAINRRWFYTKFAMQPHSEATFNVRYKVYTNSNVGLCSGYYEFSCYERKIREPDYNCDISFTQRYFTHGFHILYDFTPAKHFGNARPYPINIDIDLSNLSNAWFYGDNGYWYYGINHIKRFVLFNAEAIKSVNIYVHYEPDYSKSNINRIIDRFKIPKSAFEVSMKGNTVLIGFRQPVFVSDVACYMDTAGIKNIYSVVTYADGSEKQYLYKQTTHPDYEGLTSPIVLTITDMYEDGITDRSDTYYEFLPLDTSFEDDKFKIKSIKLIFDTEKKAKSVCKNIKVLDARFVKTK